MQLLQLVLGNFVRRPANDETFVIGCSGLGDDMEMDMVDLLVSDTTVVLK